MVGPHDESPRQSQLPLHTCSTRLSDIAIIATTFLGLFAVLIWLVGSQGVEDTPESFGSSHSSGPRGTLALYRWLERAGFEVSRTERGDRFPPAADTLIMVNPNNDFPTGQAGTVRRWVGGQHARPSDWRATSAWRKHPCWRFGFDVTYSSSSPHRPMSRHVRKAPVVHWACPDRWCSTAAHQKCRWLLIPGTGDGLA